MYGAATGIIWNKMLALAKEEEKPDFLRLPKTLKIGVRMTIYFLRSTMTY